MSKARNASLYVLTALCWAGAILALAFPLRTILFRLLQSLWDLVTAVGYYFCYIFVDEVPFDSPVVQIPAGMESLLPIDWDVFEAKLSAFWLKLWDSENFLAWVLHSIRTLEPTLRILLLLLPLCVSIRFLIPALLYRESTKKGQTKPLRCWLWLENHVFGPILRYVKDFWNALTAKGWHRFLTVLLFFVTFNLLTILIEAIALNLYTHVLKAGKSKIFYYVQNLKNEVEGTNEKVSKT